MAQSDNDHGPDLWHYWRIIKKRVWVILGTTLAIAAVAIITTMRKPKVYQATAEIIIAPQAPKALGDSVEVVQLGAGGYWSDTEYYSTQLRILTSFSLAREAVLRFSLQNDVRLVGERGSRGDSEIIDDATEELRGRILVTPVKDSHVFAIAVRGTNRELAVELANDVALVYIDQNLAVKREVTSKAKGWVSKLLDDARHGLDSSETALYAYKKDKNILSISLEDQKNKISKALDAFSTALTDARRRHIELQARRKAVGALVKGDIAKAPSSFVVDSPLIDKLRATYLEEQSKLAGLEERYGPKHTDVVIAQARVKASLGNLQQAADALLKSMDAEIGALQDAEARYADEVAGLTKEAFELGKQEIEYKRLSRDAANAEQVYTQLLKRLNENGLQAQDGANNVRLLDEARLPDVPVEPNLRLAALLGLALGLSLGMVLSFSLEYLDRTVKSQEDIDQLLGLPFLGIVPTVDHLTQADRAWPEMHVFNQPKSTVAECCRVVRTNVLFCSPDKPLKTMIVTSPGSVEGKSMNVLHLGIVMAQSGQRTLLVDTDMRRPRLHKTLRCSNERGVSELIVGDGDIDAAIKSTEVPNLFLLPCGPIPPNPAELLQTERFAALVAALGQRFDRVIFDSPPILAVTDAAILSRVLDGTVLVARSGRTSREALARGHQMLGNVNARVIGVVLNDVNLHNPHYAHYYSYYFEKYAEASAAAMPSGPSGS
jgi:capsular exopolysaccharide synthesis family protein